MSESKADRRGLRFYPWNAAGWLSYHFGSLVHKIGLWFCGKAGELDAIADRHR